MKDPQVEFCGYTIPHPSEPKMHLRIQTVENVSAVDVLERAVERLEEMCDVITEKFVDAVKRGDYEKHMDEEV